MTKDDFLFLIQTKTVREFNYKGVIYNLTFDKDEKGNDLIVFGRLYEGQKYKSVGEFLNTCKIENHFFKDMLDIF